MSTPTPPPWIAEGYDLRQKHGRMIAYFGPHHTPADEYPLSCRLQDEANAQWVAAARNELAAAKAECERLRPHSLSSGEREDYHDALNELARLRAEIAVAQNWVEHHSKHADDLIGENVKLRADLERFTGHGLLDCHAICDQRDAAVAERDQLRAEVERLKATLLSIEEDGTSEHNAAVGLRQNLVAAIARAERFEAALAKWSVLNLWGGTPEIIHEFIKGQQNRIHHCQDLEAELLEQARLLGMSGEREADLLGKIERLAKDKARLDWLEDHGWITGEPCDRAAIDAAMKP